MALTIIPTILINNIYIERVAITRMNNGSTRMIILRITYSGYLYSSYNQYTCL